MQGTDPVDSAWRANRAYLVDLAYRMLGDIGAAEDVVQEAFSRLMQVEVDTIDDERGWLIVVTSRLCLDTLKSARTRREQAQDSAELDRLHPSGTHVDPADRVTLDDNVRLALVVVLQRLTPAERVVFVLHDIFRMPFDAIAETVGRTSAGCRQLARRARQKIAAAGGDTSPEVDPALQQHVVERFIAACASGDLAGLVAVLDPEASGSIDTRPGLVVLGADRVARNLIRFWGQPSTRLVSQSVGGRPALLGFADRNLQGILLLTVVDHRVSEVHVVADATMLELVRRQLSASGL